MGKIKPDQTEYILPRCNFFKTKTEFDKKKKSITTSIKRTNLRL